MCGRRLRHPSNGWIGKKERFWRVMLRKTMVLLDSIFVVLKNIDGALFRERSSSPEKIECNQGA
jgi:hypothetical protein